MKFASEIIEEIKQGKQMKTMAGYVTGEAFEQYLNDNGNNEKETNSGQNT